MFLAEAKRLEAGECARLAVQDAMAKWEDMPASTLCDHRRACCRTAREWLLAMDYSHMNPGDALMGPRWIRQRYKWGPTRWPIHWCEAIPAKTLDCGALAALSQKAYLARGVRCYTTQFVQRYTVEDSRHWYSSWARDQAEVHWIQDDLVYHEACAVVVSDNEIRIWDPTASWWVNPKQFDGYGAVLALRILTPQSVHPQAFNWGVHRVTTNQWQPLESARGDFA
jgi:hypothetical protein